MTATTTPATAPVLAALRRYRVMAIVTGSFLLLVTVDVAVKYGGRYLLDWENEAFLTFSSAVAIIHGWIYVVYLVTAVDMWTRMKWSLGRLAYMVLGGVVPFLSFFAEKRITREVRNGADA